MRNKADRHRPAPGHGQPLRSPLDRPGCRYLSMKSCLQGQSKATRPKEEALAAFADHFQNAYATGFRQKLGFRQARDGDELIAQDLLERMDAGNADFTLTFRGLAVAAADPAHDAQVARLFAEPAALLDWLPRWRARLAEEGGDGDARSMAMQSVNPAFIPRNHLVAEVIAAAMQNDYAPFERLLAVLARPYADQPDAARYTLPPEEHEVVRQTFCGT